MTDRAPEQNPIGSIDERVPHSGKLPVDQGGERPSVLLDLAAIREAVERGEYPGAHIDSQGNLVFQAPDTLKGADTSKRKARTEYFVPIDSPERKKMSKGAKIAIAISTAVATAITGAVMWARSSSNNDAQTVPTVTATVGSTPPTPTEQTPTPTPSATESARQPYDEDVVRVLEKDTVEEFREESQDKKVQYYLKNFKEQSDKFQLGGPGLSQKIDRSGRITYEYLPWGSVGLHSQSDPQDVLNSYVANQNVIFEQEDEATALKMMYSLIKSPSDAFEADVIKYHGQPGYGVNANNSTYRADTWEAFEENGRNGWEIKCPKITYRFVFYKAKGLSEADADSTNDSKQGGIWVRTSLVVR